MEVVAYLCIVVCALKLLDMVSSWIRHYVSVVKAADTFTERHDLLNRMAGDAAWRKVVGFLFRGPTVAIGCSILLLTFPNQRSWVGIVASSLVAAVASLMVLVVILDVIISDGRLGMMDLRLRTSLVLIPSRHLGGARAAPALLIVVSASSSITLAFATLSEQLQRYQPGSFQLGNHGFGAIDALYFSITTLTTVGYGDIHAVSQAAELVVIAEIASGVLALSLFASVLLGLRDEVSE